MEKTLVDGKNIAVLFFSDANRVPYLDHADTVFLVFSDKKVGFLSVEFSYVSYCS